MPSYNFFDAAARGIVTSVKKQCNRRDKTLLDSGYYDTETWGALKKCWKGYKIAKSEIDYNKMEYYANGIRKFQQELNISIIDFPQFGLIGSKMPCEQDSENDFYSDPYDQAQRNLENYELQLKQEKELDPYSTELEPNLLMDQAEYYKRILRDYMGNDSDEVW